MIETRPLPNGCRIDRHVFESRDGTCSYEYYIRSSDVVGELKLPTHLGGKSIWTIAGHPFKLVHDLCDEALDTAIKKRIPGLGMANAFRLSCVEVVRRRRDDGDEWWQVRITEAAPEAYELREFVRQHMEANGINGVEVVTEW